MVVGSGPWLVLRIKPPQEARVAQNVRRQATEYYHPRALVRSSKTRALRVAPLFPGYAFARPPTPVWTYLRSTYGVLDVLMSTGESPATITDAELGRLRAREGPDGLIRLSVTEFCCGEVVVVEGGPFTDLSGEIEGMSGRDRVFVLMQLLGRKVRVKIDVRDLRRG